jgi:hypothetical protein
MAERGTMYYRVEKHFNKDGRLFLKRKFYRLMANAVIVVFRTRMNYGAIFSYLLFILAILENG